METLQSGFSRVGPLTLLASAGVYIHYLLMNKYLQRCQRRNIEYQR